VSPADEFAKRLHRVTVAATEYHSVVISLSEWVGARMSTREGLLASEASRQARTNEALRAGELAAKSDCPCECCVKNRGAGIDAAVAVAKRTTGTARPEGSS